MDLIVHAGSFIVGLIVLFYGLWFVVWACVAATSILFYLGTELVDYLYNLLHPLHGINK